MKKIISILLVALTVFSFATVAFAADEAVTEKPVTVIFEVYDSKANLKYVTVKVGYGEKIAVPDTPSWEHPSDKTQRMFFTHWTSNHSSYKGQLIENILPINANDGIKEITFTAQYEPRENNIQNNFQDSFDNIVENLPGADAFEGMGDAFSTIIELIRKWVMQFILYIRAFF